MNRRVLLAGAQSAQPREVTIKGWVSGPDSPPRALSRSYRSEFRSVSVGSAVTRSQDTSGAYTRRR